jgi:methionine-rich copper-binding protein CopC
MSGSARSWAGRAVIAVVLTGTPALAYARHDATAADVTRFHLELTRAEPRKNDTVMVSPAEIKLWFSESVQPKAVTVRLANPQRELVAIGAITVDTAPKSPAVVKVPQTLEPGTYWVAWHALASDGHPGSGGFAFTIRAASEK